MQRRQFVGAAAGALAASALTGCAGSLEINEGVRSPASPGPTNAATFGAARRYVATRYGRIAYVERGTGDAALVLHGFPLNSFQWRGALDRLSTQRRCIAPDFLGLGYTQVAPGQSVAPDAQVSMLIELLDKLSVGSVDVVANDSGGAVAQLLLVKHPQRVRTLLLTNCDTAIESPPPAMLPVIELAKQGTYVDEWLAPWHEDPRKARSP